MGNIAYLALDIHARHSVLGKMDSKGNFKGNQKFPTSEVNIVNALKTVREKKKYLAIEEGTLTYWAAQVAHPYVTEVICCDPRENALIYRGHNKRDTIDTRQLCRLLRLGELKRVYHPQDDERAVFKAAAQHYIDFRDQQTKLKQKIKAMYRHWGVVNVFGEAVYTKKGRNKYIEQVKHIVIQNQLNRLYAVLDKTTTMQDNALKDLKRLGRKYPEIKEFKKISGIGDVGAHTFDAFLQTPDRFANKRQVWRYFRLGITDRSSDGKPLGYKRLDRSGIPEMKAVTHRAWMSCMKGDNEIRRFYSNSLKRTSSRVHARLNTQRKIIAVMYGLWKTGEAYRPQVFLDASQSGVD